ncbi:hypothetical protein, partial [Cryobacterium sp. Hz9]|uniref:hypothetical protein n=1 Tax=Cryobacterium sp. Hz9 TaxID=1259167 RepID=UPI00106B2AAA
MTIPRRALSRKIILRRRRKFVRHALIAAMACAAIISAVGAPATMPNPGSTEAAAVTARTVIDSSSPRISYSGTWRSTRSTADRGGSVRFQSSAGSASMTFEGTSVAYITRTTKDSGKSNVSIDGKVVTSVNGYSATSVHQKTAFSTTNLTSGSHTITISRTGKRDVRSSGTNSIVDAFVVNAAASPAPAPASPRPPAPVRVPASDTHRYADCPAATVTVTTARELMAAVDQSGPGTV